MGCRKKYTFLFGSLLSVILQLVHPALCGNLAAQVDTTNGTTRINGTYLLSYWHDTKSIVAEPFHWKGRQWAWFTGIVGAGVITYAYDDKIHDLFQENRTETTDAISKYLLEPWGSGLYSIPLLAGLYLSSPGDSRHRRIALTGIKAYLLTGGATAVTKLLFHRHRPGDDQPPDPRNWDGPFPFTLDHTSFPSFHAASSFAVATVLAMGYSDHLWVGITSYTLAGLVSISRVHDNKHWASDVVAGAALGFFIGATLSKINMKNLEIGPASFNGGQGVRLVWSIP